MVRIVTTAANRTRHTRPLHYKYTRTHFGLWYSATKSGNIMGVVTCWLASPSWMDPMEMNIIDNEHSITNRIIGTQAVSAILRKNTYHVTSAAKSTQ